MEHELTTNSAGGAMAQQESQRAIAEVQAAMILARKFPRNEQAALDRMMVAFQRQGLAEQALYSYSRGGSEITGPSIRAAEAIAQHWGNLQFGIRELSQDNGVSTIETFAWDVETNVRQVKVFQVKHVRSKRSGNVKLTDPRDVYELVANQGARRLRACILGIIPGDIVEAVVNQTDETLKAKADTSPAAIKKLTEAFAAMGVSKEMLEKRIQRRLDAITPAQIVALRKVYNSLKDGMSKPADWFEDIKEPKEGGTASDLMGRFGFKEKETGGPEPDPPPEQTDTPDLCPACQKVRIEGYCRNPSCPEGIPPE
jgi:hypothetical protein